MQNMVRPSSGLIARANRNGAISPENLGSKVSRFAKRKGGKGKRGRHASSFMASSEVEAFFKGKGKRMRKSSGKGFSKGFSFKGLGERTNPRSADGQIMKCTICESTTHFRAKCPRQARSGAGGGPSI